MDNLWIYLCCGNRFYIHLVYFGLSELRLPINVLTYLIPLLTVISYTLTVLFLLYKIKTESNFKGIYLTNFPKKAFVILILALLLKPAASKLSGLYAEYFVSALDVAANDYLEFYGWMHASFAFSRWASVIILAIIYLKKYQSLKFKS